MMRRILFRLAVVIIAALIAWQGFESLSSFKDRSNQQYSNEATQNVNVNVIDTMAPPTVSDEIEKLIKSNKAYFGIDEKGKFNLYQGEPKDDQVIRAFFQIDIEHLKSSLPLDTVRKLENGIKVSDANEYNSVLSTFSDFSTERNLN